MTAFPESAPDEAEGARRTSLVRETARRLVFDLCQGGKGEGLPPLKVLAAHYGVGWNTMQKAAALTREWGFLDYAQGRSPQLPRALRPQLPNRAPETPGASAAFPTASALLTPSEQLLDFLRDKLERGEYPAGSPLPKSLYFIRRFRVSGHTLVAALRKLEAEGLVHKSGRRYLAGRELPSFRTRGSTAPVIFLVERDLFYWNVLHNPRTEPFCREFDQEAQRCGVRILPMPVEGRASVTGSFEPENILRRGREFGDRLLGSLLVGDPAELPGWESGLKAMNALKKPVVWFDRNDSGWPAAWEQKSPVTQLVRMHFSEEMACREALWQLYSYGHRHVVYPRLHEEEWVERRFRMLQDIAARSFPGLKVERIPNLLEFYQALTQDRERRLAFKGRCQALLKQFPNHVDAAALETAFKALEGGAPAGDLYFLFHKADLLVFLLPQMDAILSQPRVTALLAPNDWHGRKFLNWLLFQNIPLPEALSVLSFDNQRSKRWDPLSSVDFGFGYLGYAALHYLAKDISLKPDRKGGFPAKAKVVDRGSVGEIGPNAAAWRKWRG